ncbi:MAG: VOC family protein [Pirellulaceae bacterium]|nr:VOC family protein [Pirellulaceae bacterium]
MSPVVHFELHSPNLEKSREFFQSVMGWELTNWGGGPKEYWLTKTHEQGAPGINGGMMRSRDADSRTVNTIEVSSVDDYVAKILAARGEIVVPKMAIPEVGYLAYAKDPAGVLFGIMHPDTAAK